MRRESHCSCQRPGTACDAVPKQAFGQREARQHARARSAVHRGRVDRSGRHRHHRRHLPAHRGGHRAGARGHRGRHRRRGRGGAARVRRGALAADVARGARRDRRAAVGDLRRAAAGDGRPRHRRDGLADHVLGVRAGRDPADGAAVLRRPRRHLRVGGRAAGDAGAGHGHAGARRRRRGDRPVERAPVHADAQARARPHRRVHGGRQAVSGDAARLLPARRVDPRGRAPGGRRQHRPGRAGGRRLPGRAPRRRQGVVHRLHRGRPQDRRGLRRAAQAGDAGARRQVGRDHPGRRRPGLGRRGVRWRR